MRMFNIQGIIDRRILLNYRVEPAALAAQLPAPFRPQVINNWGIAGVCLIRLRDVRPSWMPGFCGLGSENAAYRTAVEWDTETGVQQGVFVWRRATSSRLNAIAGGRVFPGVHSHREFAVKETERTFNVSVAESAHALPELAVETKLSSKFESVVFRSFQRATACICCDAIGYSPDRSGRTFEGLHLELHDPKSESLEVTALRSEFFEDEDRFPRGTAHFDHAVLMRGVHHRWISQPNLSATNSQEVCHT